MISQRKTIFFLAFAILSGGLFAREHDISQEQFVFQSRTYHLDTVFSGGQADLQLRGRGEVNLSAGMLGENLLLGVRYGSDNFYVFWLNYHQKANRLAYYDHRFGRSHILPLNGFSSFSLPEILETNSEPQALVFLGNNSDNDDIFHYELTTEVLTPLTRTPFSEKNIILQKTDNGLEIETKSLLAKYRYRFNHQNRQCQLLKEERFSQPQKRQARAATTITPEYFNTYIGFGDSITWGQIRIIQRLDLCYLTQMRDVYLALDYGPSQFLNLGNPGQTTYDRTLSVDQDLDANPGFYFLLMLGVNDVQKPEFSLASSRENLEYIVDAALAHNMRVIISTLTPRKDEKSQLQWYWDNLHALSNAILNIAQEKGTACIDTLGAFMNTDPPDGWKDLLEEPGWVEDEEGKEVWVKGNHPNEEGHKVIAALFAATLVKFPPLAPTNISVVNSQNNLRRTALWDENYESDFSHFHIEFGFQPGVLNYSLTSTPSYCTFNLFPFLPRLYFRIQTVDRGGRRSAFSTVNGVSPATSPAQKSNK